MAKKHSTASFLQLKKQEQKIVCISLYDALSAKLAERAGVDLILVGDSLGMTVLGYESTVRVTMEQMLSHSAAVKRGAQQSFVVADMPFASYHADISAAVANASRFIREAGVDAVKIEGGIEQVELIKKLVQAGIPVMGHVGLLPQQVLVDGGYKGKGRSEEEAERIMQDALAIQEAGVFSLVAECVKAELAGSLSEALTIPVIGIGSGVACDGQIQVINDVLGLDPDFTPKHAKKYADLGGQILGVLETYGQECRKMDFPSGDHSF